MDDGGRPTRRDVLTTGGSAAIAGALMVGAAAPAVAQTHAGRLISIGSLEFTILSDGHMAFASTALAVNVAEVELKSFLEQRRLDADRVEFSINVALIKSGRDRILIDAGAGGTWEPTAGKLAENLERAGIRNDEITKVVITHAHPDHLWGLVDELDDSLRFANAEYYVGAREFEFWMSPQAANLSGPIEGIAAGARRVFRAIAARTTLIKAGQEFLPGLFAIDTAGHTPGHLSLLAGTGDEKVLLTADAVQNAYVSFAHPDWWPRPDMNGEAASRSRRRLLDMAVSDKLSVLAYHIPFPGLGRVERMGAAYTWVSVA